VTNVVNVLKCSLTASDVSCQLNQVFREDTTSSVYRDSAGREVTLIRLDQSQAAVHEKLCSRDGLQVDSTRLTAANLFFKSDFFYSVHVTQHK
jgi:hypothetical protein